MVTVIGAGCKLLIFPKKSTIHTVFGENSARRLLDWRCNNRNPVALIFIQKLRGFLTEYRYKNIQRKIEEYLDRGRTTSTRDQTRHIFPNLRLMELRAVFGTRDGNLMEGDIAYEKTCESSRFS